MLYRSFIILILGMYFPASLSGGGDNYLAGSRSAALSHASVTLRDPWATFHNQAGLAHIEGWSGGIYTDRKFGLKSLSAGAATLSYGHPGTGTFGVGYYYFSPEGLYTQQKISLAYARSFGKKLSAGFQFDLFDIKLREYGHKTALLGEAGIQVQLTPELRTGLHIFNPLAQSFANYREERIPTIIRFGAGYHFSGKVSTLAELEKTTGYDPIYRAAIEFSIKENLFIQAGISGLPISNTAGIRFTWKGISANLAFAFHQKLGLTPSASLVYHQSKTR